MACRRRKATAGMLAPNIQRGGIAIPLGNNLYWMKGRKHKSGGIDIGKDLEVENNEVMQMLPTETRVFSSIKMLGGNSPAELVAGGLNPSVVFALQELYKKLNRINDDGTRYKNGGKAKLGKRIKGAEENGSRDIYYDDEQQRWVWGSNRQILPLGHRVKLNDGYEYQLNSDGSRTRIGKKPNAYERMITFPMQYTPNNDKVEAIGDVLTAPFVDQGETYYNGILPLRNGFQYKDAPLYAYRTGDMSYLKNDDNYIRTIDRSNNPALPRKLYTFYNQDTLYLPSTLIQNLDRLKQGIGMNQENVNRDYIYGAEYKPIIDARNHHMQVRQLDNRKYVADFSDVFDVNDEFFDSKANPIVFSQYGVPVEFTGDSTKWNDSFVGELNKALSKKYGGKMNLQNIQHNSLTNSKRTISPNKIGTIVRIDGNGKDKLNYIPSTGSSQQVMKCGGRAKGRLGLSSGVKNMLDNILLAKYPNLNKNMSEDERIDAWDNLLYGNIGDATREDIVLDDGTIWNVNLPETTVVAPVKEKWTPPKINISTPNPYANRPGVVIGNNPSDNELEEKIKSPSDNTNYHWIKTAGDLLTTGLSTFNNLYYLNRMKEPPVPVADPGVKLPTRISNLSTLEQIRRNLNNTKEHYFQNTGSSQALRNLVNTANLNSLGLIQQSNEQKSNKEVELMKEDAKQRAITQASNIERYNKYLDARTVFRNAILDKRSETWNNMMSNVNKVINEGIENKERMDAERRQFDFLSYAYPILRNNPNVKQYLYNILFGKGKES